MQRTPLAYSIAYWTLFFFAYSFAGWCWEVGLYLVKLRRLINRGFLLGPFLPVYGFGALLIVAACQPVRGSLLRTALTGAAAATLLEYAAGAGMEALFHMRCWDYSSSPFNLDGHVCLLSSAVWAGFSVLLVFAVHPLVQALVTSLPAPAASVLAGTLAVFAAADTAFAIRRAFSVRALLEEGGNAAEKADLTAQAKRERRMRRAQRMLCANPDASSRRYKERLNALKQSSAGLKTFSHHDRAGIPWNREESPS